jgi:phosphatidylglycerol---prolipoprotein diacylglyceryl transferase
VIHHVRIGPWTLTLYTLFHAAGIVLAGTLGLRELRRIGFSVRSAASALLLFLVFAHAGAHFYHAVAQPVSDPGWSGGLLDFWTRGLALHGGLLGAGAAVLLASRIWSRSPWQFADALAPPAALALFFFRLGCFSRGCCYGRPCGERFLLAGWSTRLVHNVETSLHPTQLYEAAAALVLFGILWGLRRRKIFEGGLVISFLLGYGAQRFLIEFLRDSTLQGRLRFPVLFLQLNTNQLFALGFFALGAVLLLFRRQAFRKGLRRNAAPGGV